MQVRSDIEKLIQATAENIVDGRLKPDCNPEISPYGHIMLVLDKLGCQQQNLTSQDRQDFERLLKIKIVRKIVMSIWRMYEPVWYASICDHGTAKNQWDKFVVTQLYL
jgi:hypothetical protein